MKIPIQILILVLFCALMGSAGQIFFKKKKKNFSFNFKGILTNYFFIVGALLYGISAVLFVWALKYGELSILYQLIATSHIWVVLLSMFVFKESFSLSKWFGVVLIISGIFFIVS